MVGNGVNNVSNPARSGTQTGHKPGPKPTAHGFEDWQAEPPAPMSRVGGSGLARLTGLGLSRLGAFEPGRNITNPN